MHDRRVHTCTTSRLHAVEVAANRGQAGRLRDGPEQRNRRGIGGEIAHTLCMPGSGQGWLLFFARDGFESSTAHRSHKKDGEWADADEGDAVETLTAGGGMSQHLNPIRIVVYRETGGPKR